MTAFLLNRVQDEPDRALDLPVQVSDQMRESAGLRMLGEQLARGSEPLGGSLAYLRPETLDDAFLPRRKRRQGLLSWCHADPFPNAADCRPSKTPMGAGRRRRLGRALNTPGYESTTPLTPGWSVAERAAARLAETLGITVHPDTALRLVTAAPEPELTGVPEVLGG
jgi:hypothetical protein